MEAIFRYGAGAFQRSGEANILNQVRQQLKHYMMWVNPAFRGFGNNTQGHSYTFAQIVGLAQDGIGPFYKKRTLFQSWNPVDRNDEPSLNTLVSADVLPYYLMIKECILKLCEWGIQSTTFGNFDIPV